MLQSCGKSTSIKTLIFRKLFHLTEHSTLPAMINLFKCKPDLGIEFHRAMEALTVVAVRDIASRYPFEGLLHNCSDSDKSNVIVDVGGGRGHGIDRIRAKMRSDRIRF